MQKRAETEHPIHDLVAERWSPRAFEDRSVEPVKIASLLEAARWGPSCFNEQPWRFLVARREDGEAFDRIAGTLMEGNAWAKKAPVLMLSVARESFARNDKPNRHAQHDVGLAVGGLLVQAEALGLATHQMAGFDADAAREALSIPDGYTPMAVIAVGYAGDPASLPDELEERERAPRQRKDLGEIAFGGTWEAPLEL